MTSWTLQGGEGETGYVFMKQKGEKKKTFGASDSMSDRAWPLCAICCFMTQEMHKGFADSSVPSLTSPLRYGFIFILFIHLKIWLFLYMQGAESTMLS